MLKPKKSLGQNFLKDKTTAKRIVSCLSIAPTDTVIEIGPGTGALTNHLLDSGANIIAVDIDSRMINFLAQKHHDRTNLEAIHLDILDFDFPAHAHNHKIKVIGNLPYHLTSAVLEKLCDNAHLIESAVLTIQKEVAERLSAQVDSSDYSSLTIFVNNFAKVALLFDLSKTHFHPPPRVTSSVIKLDFYDQPVISFSKYEQIRDLIRTAFSQKRKMMINSLLKIYNINRDEAIQILESAEIDSKARPQNISLTHFIKLAEILDKYEKIN